MLGKECAQMDVASALEELLGRPDIAVDCTMKKVTVHNVEVYRQRVLRFPAGGGAMRPVAGHLLFAKVTLGPGA